MWVLLCDQASRRSCNAAFVQLAVRLHARRQRRVLACRRAQPKHVRPSHDPTTASHRCPRWRRTVNSQTYPTDTAKHDSDHNRFAWLRKCGSQRACLGGLLQCIPVVLDLPHQLADVPGGVVAILGHTTGSHLGLADAEESQETLVWVAETVSDAVASWTLIEDTPINRSRFRLEPQPQSAPPEAG